jgi:germination protein YpeB
MKVTKKRIAYTAIVTLMVVFSSTFAILMTLERTDYRNYLQGEYSKNMYDLVNSVENIRVNLGKASIVGSREQAISVFDEIFRYSSIAKDKIHSLPVSQTDIGNTSKFLSQVGDFCSTLGKSSSQGRQLRDEDYAMIDTLKNQAFTLEQQLKQVSDNINNGNVKWGEIRQTANGVLANNNLDVLSDKFMGVDKQVTQYPSLIYDGPFSENVLEITPKINSKTIVSEKQAEETVRNIIGKDRIESLRLISDQVKEKIDVYRFSATVKGKNNSNETIVCEVSKKGGKIVYLLDSRNISNPTINVKTAANIGSSYLQENGYKNMIPSYSLSYGNIAIINYVYSYHNVIIYPDQIKLKIALDNGGIIGIESQKYLIAHDENRTIPEAKVTLEQARQKVGKKLNVTSQRLAIIPIEMNKEVLCYEFSGNYKGDNFIVYIDAETGYEQKIIQIINTPNGELTM